MMKDRDVSIEMGRFSWHVSLDRGHPRYGTFSIPWNLWF